MKKKKHTGLIVFLVLLLAIGIGCGVVYYKFNIEKVTVTGNESGIYTDSEIVSMVLGNDLKQNTVICYLENRFNDHQDISFIQKYQVEIIGPNEVEIIIYEKEIIGYVAFMGNYLYFDYDGTVVESSTVKRDDIVEVTGVKFSEMVLGETMKTENPEYFDAVLSLTQLFDKYGLKTIDTIHFEEDGQIRVLVGNIKVELGTADYADQKVSEMNDILPQLTNYKGTLYLNNVTSIASGDGVYYFKLDE